jgi:hypothetical protein
MSQLAVQPCPVPQLDPANVNSRQVAVGGGERIALDRAQAKSVPLVEAQVVDVRGGGRLWVPRTPSRLLTSAFAADSVGGPAASPQ